MTGRVQYIIFDLFFVWFREHTDCGQREVVLVVGDEVAAKFELALRMRTKGIDFADKKIRIRTEQSVPILDDLKQAFKAALNKISNKSQLAGTIRYTLSRWVSLTRYTTDGRLEMTNNAAERRDTPLGFGTQELAVRRILHRRRTRRNRLHDHLNCQDERPRS